MREVIDFIDSRDDFAIVCHKSPDGDTLGSGLGLYYSLKKYGKNCKVYCKDVPAKIFDIFDDISLVHSIDELCEKNIIFCDCADFERAACEKDLSDCDIANIDHHISNDNYGCANLVRPDACATCVVIYQLITAMGIELDATIAKCLYIGICTDTNNFTNSNTNSEAFATVAKLTEFDFGIDKLVKILFKTKTLAKTLAGGLCIDRLMLKFDNKFALSYITKEDMEKLGLDNTEGLVSIGADIEGVSVSAMIKESETGVYKISMRSNYDVDVCKICSAFGGGGHIKASGCAINGTLDEVIDALSNEVSKWME